ncbi:hypothetical protein FRB95_000991 [Tulasnella sp. JGI-2019a]|nr:hypothetical protein FRB95_000991 [Tulasnella sp. JGI-2019a]
MFGSASNYLTESDPMTILSGTARSSTKRTWFVPRRCLQTQAFSREDYAHLRRALLYVPSSSQKMLNKSLSTPVDTLIYDLEDSVAPAQKVNAQRSLTQFFSKHNLPRASEIAVRVNEVRTPMILDDVTAALSSPNVTTLVVPKVHGVTMLNNLSAILRDVGTSCPTRSSPIQIIASIESAKALQNIYSIASWKDDRAYVSALLFAAEDYCADTSIQRTRSRLELLYARSHVVNAAKAYGIQAIDMVCVDYKDPEYLAEECEDGRRLGFDGKQAIHPTQVETIQKTFAPSDKDISRAIAIISQMEVARAARGSGAFGLETQDGRTEMIDEPMVKQAQKVIERARRAGLDIPSLPSSI